jgi:hypothetical protein
MWTVLYIPSIPYTEHDVFFFLGWTQKFNTISYQKEEGGIKNVKIPEMIATLTISIPIWNILRRRILGWEALFANPNINIVGVVIIAVAGIFYPKKKGLNLHIA